MKQRILFGMVNRHSCHIWGSENPHGVAELERDSLKVSVWCALMKIKVTGSSFLKSVLW
jgi:hypothetical protein